MGTYTPPTVQELVAEFLDAKIAAGLSTATITTYRIRLARFTSWLADRELTRAVVREYLVYLQREQLSKASIWSYLNDLKVLCRWLEEEGLIAANPTRKIGFKQPKRLPASYTPDQVVRMLQVSGARDRALMLVLIDTGIRVSELCGMRRAAIDLARGEFTVVGKGDKERFVALDPYTVEALRIYLGTRTDEYPAVWIGRAGPLTRSGVLQMIERRARQAGIRGNVRRLVHAFRATFAKLYIQRGGDLGSLADLLGHSTLEMARHYSQLAHDELAAKKRRINPLGGILGDGTE